MKNKMILPLKENPSISTCIHHAYQCAIIESQELARIEINNFGQYVWNTKCCGTEYDSNDDVLSVLAEEKSNTQDFVIWRECTNCDELIINIEYMKHKDCGRCIDVFLFSDNLSDEMNSQDKSLGFRWNPYGYFVKKDMYAFDTKVFTYMKVIIKDNLMIGYASKNGMEWEEIAQINIDIIPNKYLNIGIHAHCGKNYFVIWKNMNFIQLQYNSINEWKGIYLDYYGSPRKNIDNAYGYYMAFLDVIYETTYEVLDLFSSIQDYIKWNICHFYYPEICLDEFYVPDRKQFQKLHYNHYNLFYGFDDEKKIFYAMGYGSSHKPVVSEIPYSIFDNVDLITSEKLVRMKYSANDITDLIFDVDVVKQSISEFLNCENSSKKIANILAQETLSYGLKVFDVLATEEPQKRIFFDRRVAFCILEHSKLMRERLDYLYSNFYLQNESYLNLVNQNDAIIDKATTIMNLVIKGMLKNKDYPVLLDYLVEMKELERTFFEDLLLAIS